MRALALLVVLAASAAAQMPSSTESLIDVKDLQTCGIISRFPGDVISPNCFQQSTNILADRSGVPTRRLGYAQHNGTACPGAQPIRGMWPFFAQNGSQYLVLFSSNSLFYSPGDGTCNYVPGLQGAFSGTAVMECTQLNGFLWCTDGIDPVFGTNVASTQAVSGAPTGYHIGTFRNRLLISGVPGTGSNGSASQVFLSGELNPLDYSIPAVQLSTSPAIISINGVNDGQIVTCLMGEFQNQFLIGRNYDLWGLSGYDLTDFALRKISDQVGCLEPRSVQEVTNVKYWLSYRGVEGFTGTQINRVSYPIDANILPIIAAAQQTNTASIAGNTWATGNTTVTGFNDQTGFFPTSVTIDPGTVVPSSWSFTETYPAQSGGTFVNTSTNSASGFVTLTQGSGAAFVNAGAELNNTTTNWSPSVGAWQPQAVDVFYGSFSWQSQFAISGCGAGDAVAGHFTFRILDGSGNLLLAQTVSSQIGEHFTGFSVNTSSLTVPMIEAQTNYVADGAGCSGLVLSGNPSVPFVRGNNVIFGYGDMGALTPTLFSRPAWDIDESQMSTAGTYTTVSYPTNFSDPVWETPTPTGNTTTNSSVSAVQVGQKAVVSFAVNATTNTAPNLSTLLLAAQSTGYYITPCVLVSSPASYGNFLVDAQTGGGTLTFWVSTGATCGLATSPTATWHLQVPNSVISVSTQTEYLAARALLSPVNFAGVPTLNSITFTWHPNNGRPPTTSSRWDDRYMLFFTTNTAPGAVNDHVYVYDQNQKWELWDDVDAASAALYQNTLYTGDSNATGLVYQQDVGQTDNGRAFTMTFQTADLDGGDPSMNKEFSRAYLTFGAPSSNNAAAGLSCAYSLDGSTSTYSLSPVILSQSPTSNGYFVAKLAFNASQPVTGHWLNMTCSYTGTSGPVAVHRVRLVYTNRGWD